MKRSSRALELASMLMDRVLAGEYDPRASAGVRTGSAPVVAADNLYDGLAGVAHELVELYRHGLSHYREPAVRALRAVAASCEELPQDLSYFTGRTGALALLRSARELLGTDAFERRALSRSEPCLSALRFERSDLLGGAAGVVLGGLHLLRSDAPDWVVELVVRGTDHLVREACAADEGLFWCREKLRVHPLCGLAHGASGIAFAFLELFAATRSPEAAWLAEEAMLYERTRFDRDRGNWPDFRVVFADRNALERATTEIATRWPDMTRGIDFVAWCHGAAGIGLVRERAEQLLSVPEPSEELGWAIERTRRWVKAHALSTIERLPSLSLCHGLAGNLELLRRAGGAECEALVEEATEHLFDAVAAYAPDGSFSRRFTQPELGKDGLFPGVTGIIDFLLRSSLANEPYRSSPGRDILLPVSHGHNTPLRDRLDEIPIRELIAERRETSRPDRRPSRVTSEAVAILRLRRARQECARFLERHHAPPLDARVETDPELVLLDEPSSQRTSRVLRPGGGGLECLDLPYPEAMLVQFCRPGRTIEQCLAHLATTTGAGDRSGFIRAIRRAISAAVIAPTHVWSELAGIRITKGTNE